MILALVVLLPLLAAVITMLLPQEDRALIRNFGVASSAFIFLASLALLYKFSASNAGMQLGIDVAWVKELGIRFHMGVDGISIFLVLLTTFLTPIAILGAGGSVTKRHKEFVAAMLVLETGMLGAFVALDMVLFYVFWELMLVPMYLLIGIWGGDRRIYAAIKFVLYTMVGSVLMLVAILYMYVRFHDLTGVYSFNLLDWNRMILTPTEQFWCFGAFALAFMIKVPVFPLHTWLPDAHVEAPTPGSVILAGVLLKLGTYGLLRFAMPLFPYACTKLAPWIAILGIVGIIYGALLAWAQKDAKKLIAYSSISHLGFVVLGLMTLSIAGTEGAIFIMLAHGITSGGLFLGFGMLYERRHTRLMNEYGGLWKILPKFSALYLIIMLGSVGLPGLCGFVGEFLVLVGAYDHHATVMLQGAPTMLPHPKIMTAFAALGVIFSAVYLLMMYQKIFFGPVTNEANRSLKDVSGRELGAILPLVVLTFALGLAPRPLLRRMEPAVKKHLAEYQYKYKVSNEVKQTRKARVLSKTALAGLKLREVTKALRKTLVSKKPDAGKKGLQRGKGAGDRMKIQIPGRGRRRGRGVRPAGAPRMPRMGRGSPGQRMQPLPGRPGAVRRAGEVRGPGGRRLGPAIRGRRQFKIQPKPMIPGAGQPRGGR